MNKLTTVLSVALGIWWILLTGTLAIVSSLAMILPETGSIVVSFRVGWGYAITFLVLGVLGTWLIRAALKTLRGTVALTVAVAAVAIGSLLNPVLHLVALYMWPTLIPLPLLWCKHKGVFSRYVKM